MKIQLNSKFNLSQIFVLILLFLGSMNVFNLYYYFVSAAFLVCLIANFRNIKFDRIFIVLLLFSVSYLIFYPKSWDSITTVLKQFSFPMCYIVGLNFIRPKTSEEVSQNSYKEHQISIAIIILAMGAFAHYLLNMLININSLVRNATDIWTGSMVTATGQACLAVMATGVLFAMLFSNKSKIVKGLSLFGLILVFAYNPVLAGRTLILLMALLLCVAFIFTIKTSYVNRKRKVVFFVTLFIFSVVIIYTQNLFGVRDWISSSNFSSRFDLIGFTEDERMGNKLKYISNMLNYPFGGGHLRKDVGGYAHGLYLDVYSDVGVIGFLLLVIFVTYSLIKVFLAIKNGNFSNEFVLLTICVFISMIFEFFLEPIIQGVPWFFVAFCFFSGLFNSIGVHKCMLSDKSVIEE